MSSGDATNRRESRSLARKGLLVVLVVALATGLISSTVLASTAANVAVVTGAPISRHLFDHWMFVAAKGTASETPRAPVIDPTDPPNFNECIAQVRKKIPSLERESTQTIRKDCDQLFVSLRDQVLDFLIKARWYEDRAPADHIAFSPAQVRRAFNAARHEHFPTPAQFKAFLRDTGQTVTDIMFRVRINLIYKALLKKEHLTPKALNSEVTRLFQPKTTCARYYVMSDCARA